jgi:phosphatidylserine decarboxylase
VIRVAPEGKPFIIGAFATLLLLVGFHMPVLAAIWLPLCLWVVAFFRDPVRTGERGPDLGLAPADGLVVDVREVDEPSFIGGRARRVCIFMNVFDCHVNRYPLDGAVAYRHYNPGKFLNAASEKSSLENEQSSIGLTTSHGRVLIRQIAGLIARRIITDHAVGTQVKQGDRLGMIRFGSRVDLFLPVDARLTVKQGERTVAGTTVVARWN